MQTKILTVIWSWLKTHWVVVLLLIYAFLVRFLYPATGSFAFRFDQGKDGLNVLEMLVLGKPKLIGPWTSIPGLYFGSGWYYFLGVSFLLGNFSPAAPVWGMVILALIQVYLAERYFGKVAAVSVAAGVAWLNCSVSAWNPYPLPLLSWLILILIFKISQAKQMTLKPILALGFLAGLGFHFSSAYAVFYVPILAIILIGEWRWRQKQERKGKKKLKPTRLAWQFLGKMIAMGALGLMIPFIPQIIFELRHDFSQTRSVINYFQTGGEATDTFNLTKIVTVAQQSFGELQLAVLPLIATPDGAFKLLLQLLPIIVLVVGSGYFCLQLYQKKIKPPRIFWWSFLFVLIPIFGFSFLHFNVWYVIGAFPAAVVIVSTIINRQPKAVKIFWVGAFLLTGASINWREFRWQDPAENSVFYQPQAALWQTIKTHAGERTFEVRSYQPDIYDFTWQYLILRDGLVNAYPVPVEFSYQAGETTYVPAKEALLARLPGQTGQAELIYYILDNPDPEHPYLQEWLGQNPTMAQAELVGRFGRSLWLYVFSAP